MCCCNIVVFTIHLLTFSSRAAGRVQLDSSSQARVVSTGSSSSSSSSHNSSSSSKSRRLDDRESSGRSSSPRRVGTWLRPHLRVKINSRDYKNGRYYNCKGVVQDVVFERRDVLAAVRVDGDDRKVLPDVKEGMLETCIPQEGGTVIGVAGEARGRIGRILKKDRERQVVALRMEDDEEVLTLSMDDVCEWMGASDI